MQSSGGTREVRDTLGATVNRRSPSFASLVKFGIVGSLTVAIDAVAYSILVAWGLEFDLAKALGFAIGVGFGYLANWRFTFGSRRGRFSEVFFVLVYALALVLNVAINAGVRLWLGDDFAALVVAFVAATGVSAAWNFGGMSLFVFRSPKRLVVNGIPEEMRP